MENNPDHYRFMPHAPGEDNPETPEIPAAETIENTIEESTSFSPEETVVEILEIEKPAAKVPLDDFTSQHASEIADTDFLRGTVVKILYGLLSPVTVPTIATLFIFFFSLLVIAAPGAALPYSLTVFGATAVVPLIAYYILMKIGGVESMEFKSRSERLIPYVIEFLALGATTLFFLYKGANPWIWTIYCGGAAVALVNFIINFRLRISNHCSAMAGLLASLIVIQLYGVPQVSLFWWIVGTLFFTGIIGTTAITVGRHSLWEVLAGYATGFLGIILFSLIK